MQKDVIYIDVDDDITAIIDKVKSSSHKIIALVPPKRTGVLQSAVNLRLINRAASQKDKRLVVITGDSALAGLAAAASIPVAKNLQSKPELAEITALSVDDDDDIIDGAELPVGEHAKQAGDNGKDPSAASDVASAGLVSANETRKATPPKDGKTPKTKAKKGVVPNFDKFRKKLVLIILAVLLLVGFLVWAIFFAPQARVTVSTRTTDTAVSQQVTLDGSADTSATNSLIRATTKSETEDVSANITPTGERNVGERAKGVVTFSTDSNSRLLRGVTIEAGTELTSSSGASYTTDSTIELSVFNSSDSTGITATEPGENFNGANGRASGGPNGIDAEITETTSGGTDKTVKVATSGDIEKARAAARAKVDQDAAREALVEQLGDGYVVLGENLQVDTSKLKSSVKANQEVSGTATYGGEVTYTLYAVAESELDDYLKSVIEQQIDNLDEQRVYESGAQDVQFTNVDRTDGGLRATLETNGKIGPKIEEDQVKEAAAGKRIGDIKSSIESINGVESVDVNLSPFWVTTAPDNHEKISVEFRLNE